MLVSGSAHLAVDFLCESAAACTTVQPTAARRLQLTILTLCLALDETDGCVVGDKGGSAATGDDGGGGEAERCGDLERFRFFAPMVV